MRTNAGAGACVRGRSRRDSRAWGRLRVAAVLLVAAALVGVVGGGDVATARGQVQVPASADRWASRLASASAYVDGRHGRVAFALVDQAGVVRGVRLRARFLSASLVKAMLLVSYLNQAAVRQRPLAKTARKLLAAMIQRSDNDAATSVRDMVGNAGLREVARRAGMLDFAAARSWGSSRITAADQARFFFRLDALIPKRHRRFARRLLSTIVPSQRWGIPAAAPPGWSVFFKGGWRPANGWVVNQAAFLEGPPGRVAIAVLSDRNPSFAYGTRTLRGVASRLLPPPTPKQATATRATKTGRCSSKGAVSAILRGSLESASLLEGQQRRDARTTCPSWRQAAA